MIGSPLVRFAFAQADASGTANIPFDQNALPLNSSIAPGEVLNFQFWHRDSSPNGANLTTGLSVEFCPS